MQEKKDFLKGVIEHIDIKEHTPFRGFAPLNLM